MWGKIIIPMYKLWLNGLYGLYGPWCPLFSKRPINLISLSLWPLIGQAVSCICRQTLDQIRLKLGGPTHYGTFQVWVTLGHAPPNFHSFLATELSSSFHVFADKQLIVLGWNLAGKLITLYWPPQVGLTFGHAPLKFHNIQASDWLSSFCAFADKPLIGLGHKFGELTHCKSPQAWLTFCHSPLSSCHFLASDWSSNFCLFADKQLFGLGSNLVDQLIMGLPWPDWLLAILHSMPNKAWDEIIHPFLNFKKCPQ